MPLSFLFIFLSFFWSGLFLYFCCSLITTLSDLCFLIKEQTCSLGRLLVSK